jgi:hypothetical protein
MEEILAESEHLILVHEFESAFVIDRRTSVRSDAGDHYGDPEVGIIGPDESWAATGGEGVIVWRRTGLSEYLRRGHIPESTELQLGEYFAVTSLRLVAPDLLSIQIDPLSRLASEWILEVGTGELRKVPDSAV